MSLDGKTPVGYANITEEDSSNEVSFTVASRGPSESYRATRDVDDIMGEISTKVNRGNKSIREEGLDLVGNKSGAQTIDQICSIYDYMVGKWTYVSDWKGLDEFQFSNYTLEKGIEVGSSGKGDCDDFAILLASLIESIGGTPRVIFAYSPHGGHAYTEVYLGKENDRDVERMLRWLRTAYNVSDLYIHEDLENGDVWLNMDWWKEPGGAEHPGGPFYQATDNRPMYIRADEDKTSLTPIENLLPKPLFNHSPIQPEVDDVVSFDASESIDPDGKIVDYEWDFGDGETAHGIGKSKCRHIYMISGAFKANLTLTDSEGEKSTITSEINVIEPLPLALGTYSPSEPEVGEVVNFDASQSKDRRGKIIDYEWDFDDGYLGKRESIDHQYLKNGSYSVKLTVVNDKGVKNSSTININISLKEVKPNLRITETDILQPSYASEDQSKKWHINPRYAVDWYDIGRDLEIQHQYDEALEAYDEAIKINPRYADAWWARGNVLYNLALYNDSCESYQNATDINPIHVNAWIGRGNALAQLGLGNESRAAYGKAKDLGYPG